MVQLEIGIGRSIFTLDYEEFGYHFTNCWIKHLWKFTDQMNIWIQHFRTKLPTPQRENNLSLMEFFHDESYKKKKSIDADFISKCSPSQMSLTVTAMGSLNTYLCQKDNTRESQFQWPQQTRPNASTIRD